MHFNSISAQTPLCESIGDLNKSSILPTIFVRTDTHKEEIFYFTGTKSDLRDDPKILENLQKRIKKPVSEQAGRDLAKAGTNNLLHPIIDSFLRILN